MRILLFVILILSSCNSYKIHYVKGESTEKRMRKVKRQNKKARNFNNYIKLKNVMYRRSL